jgi:hypothetical protein
MSSAISSCSLDSFFPIYYSLKQQSRRNAKQQKYWRFLFIQAAAASAAAAANLGQGDLRAKSALYCSRRVWLW